MIELEKEFTSGVGGFGANPLTYRQFKRHGNLAVYERFGNDKLYDVEVIRIKVDPKGKVYKFPNGVVQTLEDDMEKYPSSSQWGRMGWTYPTLAFAMIRFNQLIKETESAEIVDEPSSEDVSTDVVEKINSNHSVPEEKESPEDKPYKGPDLIIPVGEFSTKDLAAHNKVQYPIAFLFRRNAEKIGKIKFSRKQKPEGRGKPTDIFVAV